MTLKEEVIIFDLHSNAIQFSELEIEKELNNKRKSELDHLLKSYSFELLDDKKRNLIEKIKNSFVELIHYARG